MLNIQRGSKERTKRILRFCVLIFSGSMFWSGEGYTQQSAPPTTAPALQPQAYPAQAPSAGEQPKTMLFRHPKQGYFVAIPPGAIVEHRDEVSGIAMKSRKGYMITLQTGPAKVGTPLPDLMSRLEQRYLGPGRPWSHKMGEQPTRLAGREAFEAVYEGAGSRVRVVVTRGSKFDYAFIFIAPPQEFQKLEADFNWVLQSFRPAPSAAGEQAPGQENDGLVEMIRGKVRHLPDSGLGFAIDYPHSWMAEKGKGPLVVISGRKGTPAYFATVNIQNVRPQPGVANITQATESVVATLKRQLKEADSNVRFPGQGTYVYAKQGITLNGLQFTVEYERGGHAFRQWTIVLARPDNGLVHVWSYAAPSDRYDRYGSIAGKMLESWQIVPSK